MKKFFAVWVVLLMTAAFSAGTVFACGGEGHGEKEAEAYAES